jgi:hypothetical protein
VCILQQTATSKKAAFLCPLSCEYYCSSRTGYWSWMTDKRSLTYLCHLWLSIFTFHANVICHLSHHSFTWGELECRVTRLGEFSPVGWLFSLGSFCENYRCTPKIIGLPFPWFKLCSHFPQKTDKATFWATFSQTHLVTLLECQWTLWFTSSAQLSSAKLIPIWKKSLSNG